MKVCAPGDNPVPRNQRQGTAKTKTRAEVSGGGETLEAEGDGKSIAILMHHRYRFVVEKLTVRAARLCRKFQRRCAGLHCFSAFLEAQDER